ncbi:MAG: DUF2510 domain-containing protein [Candidatus Nanopelagicales bacterium]
MSKKWDKDNKRWLVQVGDDWVDEAQFREPGWYPDPSQGGQRRWWDGNQWTDHQEGAFNEQAVPVTTGHGFDGTVSQPIAIVSATCALPVHLGEQRTIDGAVVSLKQQAFALGATAVTGITVSPLANQLLVTGTAVKLHAAPVQRGGGGVGGFVGVSVPLPI